MKIDLRFTLDTENEEQRKALSFYNSLRRKNRVDVFVELTRKFWDKEIIDGGESILVNQDKELNNIPKSPTQKLPASNNGNLKEANTTKKKNPLFG
ncbi:hypothetical protein [Fluviispira vulneris]|uniref:hypothetical protein n=1 Tax=Fluviispira vulneris TaxID=2763012 RepID=UPI0016447355|nr:hypothetical protein [Fluviispira vulneris]